MSTLTLNGVYQDLLKAAPLFQAFSECSPKLQVHAKALYATISDPETDDDDRMAALITLADILFPNPHPADGMLGMDLAHAETEARQTPESADTLDAMDAEEATFAERLRAAMTERGLTQAALAERVGVGQSAVSLMLSRECRPQKRTVERLAAALDIDPDALWPGHSDR